MKNHLGDFPWYVFLFATYPVLTLLAYNIGEIEVGIAYRSLVVSILVSALLLAALYWLTGDWKKAGTLAALWILSFYLYAQAFRYIRGLDIGSIVVGRHTYFVPVWLLVAGILSWIIQRRSWPIILTPALHTMGIVLMIFPLYQLISYQNRFSSHQNPFLDTEVPAKTARIPPDIYFIVLDMYGRNDVLAEEFGYDDGFFLEQLQKMGFYVAPCSQSNYPVTTHSLAATLNANYLDGEPFTPENIDSTLLWYLIQNSAVEAILRERGYKIVAYATGYEWTEWEDADHYFSIPSSKINSFEDLLLRSSFLAVLSEGGYLDSYSASADRWKYDLTMFVLDALETAPTLPGPKFVFAHLSIPHPPFIVGPNGEFKVVPPRYKEGEDYYEMEDYKAGYRNQLAFLNQRLIPILESILAHSDQPPVILLQGDHGPRFVDLEKQVDILNAYYFPEPVPQLDPFASPVNNFRFIFNTYFGAALPQLPDKTFNPLPGTLYEFQEIPNDCTWTRN